MPQCGQLHNNAGNQPGAFRASCSAACFVNKQTPTTAASVPVKGPEGDALRAGCGQVIGQQHSTLSGAAPQPACRDEPHKASARSAGCIIELQKCMHTAS